MESSEVAAAAAAVRYGPVAVDVVFNDDDGAVATLVVVVADMVAATSKSKLQSGHLT